MVNDAVRNNVTLQHIGKTYNQKIYLASIDLMLSDGFQAVQDYINTFHLNPVKLPQDDGKGLNSTEAEKKHDESVLVGRVMDNGVSVFRLTKNSAISHGDYFFDGCVAEYKTVEEAAKAHRGNELYIENALFMESGFPTLYVPCWGINEHGQEYFHLERHNQ